MNKNVWVTFKVFTLVTLPSILCASDPGVYILFIIIFTIPVILMPGIAISALIAAQKGKWSQLNWTFLISPLAFIPIANTAGSESLRYVALLYIALSIASAIYIGIIKTPLNRANLITIVMLPPAITVIMLCYF